jgi:biopolymer transport protein ExbD
LTDVVMLLLIFFLLSSSFIAEPTISVQLRRPNPRTRRQNKRCDYLDRKGALYLNDAPVRLADLGKALAKRLKKPRSRGANPVLTRP